MERGRGGLFKKSLGRKERIFEDCRFYFFFSVGGGTKRGKGGDLLTLALKNRLVLKEKGEFGFSGFKAFTWIGKGVFFFFSKGGAGGDF